MKKLFWIDGKETYEDVPDREEHACVIGRVVAGTEDWCFACHPETPVRETSPRLLEARAYATLQDAQAESRFLANYEGDNS
jgi:hypothetical protein